MRLCRPIKGGGSEAVSKLDPIDDDRSTPALALGVLPLTDAKRNGRTPAVREGALF